jgi:hypothetical protein
MKSNNSESNVHYASRQKRNNEIQRERKNILDIGNNSVIYIRITAAIIGTIFSYLAYKRPFREILVDQVSLIQFSLVFKFLVLLVFYSKVYGILIDIRELQRELVRIKIATIPLKVYFFAGLYISTFISLLFVVDNFILFCAIFALIYIFYMLFWQKFSPYSLENIKETYKYNIQNKNEIEKLQNKILHSYFSAYWVKDVVNYVLIPCLLGIILTVFNFDDSIDKFLNVKSKSLVLASLVLIGYFISEGIIWTKRLKRKYQIRYLDKNYDIIVRKLKLD